MSLKLYYWGHSSATRVLWALLECELPFERIHLDRNAAEHRSAEHLARHPGGKIPVLIDDGVPMFESLGIMLHIAQTYGVEKGLWPKPGTREAKEAMSWATWGSANLFPYLVEYGVNSLDWMGTAPNPVPKEERSAAVAERSKQTFLHNIAILDQRLEGRDYLLGSEFSLLDACNALICVMAMSMGVDIGKKRVEEWASRCFQRPAGASAMMEM